LRKRLILLSLILYPLLPLAEQPKIGVLIPLTGVAAEYGAKVREGIEAGKVSGVEYIFEDSICQSAAALTAYKKLIEIDKVSFFLGPCCGSPARTIAPFLKGKPQLSLGVCGLSESFHRAAGGNLLITQYSIEKEGAFLVSEMKKRGVKKVGAIYVEHEFALAHMEAFKKHFQGELIPIGLPSFDAGFLKTAVLRFKKGGVDTVYSPDVEPLLLGLMAEMAKVGFSPKYVFSVYSAQMQEVLDANKEHTNGLLYSYPAIDAKEDAIVHFPRLATEMLGGAVAACG